MALFPYVFFAFFVVDILRFLFNPRDFQANVT